MAPPPASGSHHHLVMHRELRHRLGRQVSDEARIRADKLHTSVDADHLIHLGAAARGMRALGVWDGGKAGAITRRTGSIRYPPQTTMLRVASTPTPPITSHSRREQNSGHMAPGRRNKRFFTEKRRQTGRSALVFDGA